MEPPLEATVTLTPEQRAAFLSLMPGLGPGADASEIRGFFLDHREACLAELGAVPGHDQVRAGVLRLLPAVQTDAGARADARARVRAALGTFEPDKLDPSLALRRHPAWVALALLELGEQEDADPQEALAGAIDTAAAAFGALSPHDPRGPGEVLWALGEAAAEAGWLDRAVPLLEAAAQASFAEPENLGRVRLLLALTALELEPDQAPARIDAVLAGSEEATDAQTRIHALWVGAHLDRESQRLERALQRLEVALELVDTEEEPEVAARIAAALKAIGGRADDPAEA